MLPMGYPNLIKCNLSGLVTKEVDEGSNITNHITEALKGY